MQSIIHDDLTVIIPLYNKVKTFERAVRSVLNQRLLPKTLLIISNGSEIVDLKNICDLQKEYPSIKIIKQANGEISAARNRGVLESETEYVAFLEADDEWLPEHTANLLTVITKNRSADFFCAPHIIKFSNGIMSPPVALPESFNGVIKHFLSTYSKGNGLIYFSSVCYRRSFFLEIGGFPEGVKRGGDIYFWLKSGLEGVGAAINKRSVISYKKNNYRLSSNNLVVPYYVKYYTDHLSGYSIYQKKKIKNFLSKNILLHWATAKIEKNRSLKKDLRSCMFKLSKVKWVMLIISELIPSRLFDIIRNRNIRNSLSN